MKRSTILAALAGLLCLAGCSGPDALRLKSERANHALAERCADGWFQALPHTPDDERIVRKALDDWDGALAADEALVGGAK